MSREYIFGSGQLYKYPVGGGAPRKFGTLQDVNVEFQGDIKELHGQFGFPVAVGRGKQKVMIKAGNGDIDINLYNEMYFGDSAAATGSYRQAVNEAGTITPAVSSISSTSITQVGGVATATFATAHGFGADQQIAVTGATPAGYNVAAGTVLSVPSPTTITYAVPPATVSPATVQGSFVGTAYVLEVANAGTFFLDLGVQSAVDGSYLQQQASGSPAAGFYTVAAGVYTFNVAQSGLAVLINYIYTDPAGHTLTMVNQLIGTQPHFALLLAETFESEWFMVNFNDVIAGKLTLPLKLDDFAISDIELSAQVDQTGTLGWISTSV